jgi:hypothetical protein
MNEESKSCVAAKSTAECCRQSPHTRKTLRVPRSTSKGEARVSTSRKLAQFLCNLFHTVAAEIWNGGLQPRERRHPDRLSSMQLASTVEQVTSSSNTLCLS